MFCKVPKIEVEQSSPLWRCVSLSLRKVLSIRFPPFLPLSLYTHPLTLNPLFLFPLPFPFFPLPLSLLPSPFPSFPLPLPFPSSLSLPLPFPSSPSFPLLPISFLSLSLFLLPYSPLSIHVYKQRLTCLYLVKMKCQVPARAGWVLAWAISSLVVSRFANVSCLASLAMAADTRWTLKIKCERCFIISLLR